jgi:hypothetical protein
MSSGNGEILKKTRVDSWFGGAGGAGRRCWCGGETEFTLTLASLSLNSNWPTGARSALPFGCIYVCYVFRAVRWALLLRHIKKVPLFSLLGTQVIGFTAVALIGRIADPVRPYLVCEEDRPAAQQPDCCLHRRAALRLRFNGSDFLLRHFAGSIRARCPTLKSLKSLLTARWPSP